MSAKSKIAVTTVTLDLNSPKAVERFRKAAADFTEVATRSKESAIKALVESGIYEKSGKLARNYRP